tara:strand:- start:1708 stop:2976 length:1269 start_codon:yes stop_codon:yes gene_type:complete
MKNQNIDKYVSFGLYGFASGLPYVLIFITLTAWLRDVGISLTLIGFVSWIMLTYSFKFIWAPLVDRFSIPFLNKFGSRRSWVILMQIIIIFGLLVLSRINPLSSFNIFAFVAFTIAFAGSVQDIAIDALRIESAKLEDQGNLAAGYQLGYRLAILVGSSLALILAENTSWSYVYQSMSIFMALNIVLCILTSYENENIILKKLSLEETVSAPLEDFFGRFGTQMACILLLIVATYRLTDIVMGPMANPFYLDMGYTLSEIGAVIKVVGLIFAMAGVFVGGIFIKKIGLYKSLLIGAIFVMCTNLCFSYASINDKSLFLLASIVGADSFAAGIVGTVNIAFLTSLVSKKYTGFQYALLTSLMAIIGKFFGGFSGVLVENLQSLYGFNYGWMSFYIFTSLLAIPAILMIYFNKTFFINAEDKKN